MSVFLNFFIKDTKTSYQLNEDVKVVDYTNKLAVALFNKESMLIETRPFYEIQIKAISLITPTQMNFFLFDIQKIYLKCMGCWLTIKQKEKKGAVATYYIDYHKVNADGMHVVYNYKPQEQKFKEVKAKLIKFSKKSPLLNLAAAAYNRHGIAVIGFIEYGETRKYALFWANPQDETLKELACEEFLIRSRVKGFNCIAKSLDGFVNFCCFQEACYLNQEEATIISF